MSEVELAGLDESGWIRSSEHARLEHLERESGHYMINLKQDAEGFIRMNRHFPETAIISITFNDGSEQAYSGRRLNGIYDEALAVYRAQNHLDAKGYSRAPRKTVHPANKIEFVPVHAGMAP